MKKAVRYIKALDNYVTLKNNEEAAKNFKGGEDVYKKVMSDIKEAKLIFTDEYIKSAEKRFNNLPDKYITTMDVFEILEKFNFDISLCWDLDQYDELEKYLKEMKIFRGNSFKECVKGNLRKKHGGAIGSVKGKRKGGQKGGLKKSPIKIQSVESGEIFDFESKTECMKFLGWSSKKFSEFIKNKNDKKGLYKVLEIGE